MISPLFPVLLLSEFLFGLGYNALVDWAHRNRLWHVSVSVVMGVAGTLILATAFLAQVEMPFWQAALTLVGCFGASGLPMVVGSARRTVAESHKRRPWPTGAARARDAAVMELSALAHEIADAAKSGKISAALWQEKGPAAEA